MALKEFIEAKLTQGKYEIAFIDDGDSFQLSVNKVGEIFEHEGDAIVETDDTE